MAGQKPDIEPPSFATVGAGKLGELFVKATPRGLTRLARNIEINEAKSMVKEISTVEVVEPITPQFRRRQLSPIEILKKSPRRSNGFVALRPTPPEPGR